MHLFLLPAATLAIMSRYAAGHLATAELAVAGLALLFWFGVLMYRLAGAHGATVWDICISVLGAVLVGAAHGFFLFPVLLLLGGQQFSWEGCGLFSLAITVVLIVLQAFEQAQAQRPAPLARQGREWRL